MEKDFFTFEDFIKNDGITKPSQKLLREIKEEIDREENINDDIIEDITTEEDIIENEGFEDVDDEIEEDVDDEIEESPKETNEEKYYKLYKDKSEDFVCDVSIEGADPNDTESRIIIESKEWSLVFNGTLKNGKCVIPIKKLNILQEGEIGNIRLEIIAEGNLFIPWEDKFKIKLSKKVTVKVNEQKDNYRKHNKKDVGIKVKVRK
jgi:hypothetical protein